MGRWLEQARKARALRARDAARHCRRTVRLWRERRRRSRRVGFIASHQDLRRVLGQMGHRSATQRSRSGQILRREVARRAPRGLIMANLTPVRSQFRHDTSDWTAERVAKLDRQEIEQLRTNALERGEQEVAALCAAALQDGTKRRQAAPAKSAKGRRLISRSAAFEARGVFLVNTRTSWGGVCTSDVAVVLGLWVDGVKWCED